MRKRLQLLMIMTGLALTGQTSGQNCANNAVGLVPITDLGINTFQGMQGGLYGNGENAIPANHLQYGLAAASAIQPLNLSGNPAPNGAIVFLSIGMSNCNQFFGSFRDSTLTYSNRNPRMRLLNGAQGGKDLENLLNPNDTYWTTLDQIISNSNASHLQVQAIWFMQAVHITKIPPGQGLAHIDTVEKKFLILFQRLQSKFPNLKQLYCSGRDYGGYSLPGRGNPEPFAYYTGWAFRRLVERQIAGDTALAFTGAQARVPWLGWASYMWADGATPRSDGFNWVCPADYEDDGVHPNLTGRSKGAHLLMNFFKNAPTTFWYRASNITGVSTSHQNDIMVSHGYDCWQIITQNPTLFDWQLFDLSGRLKRTGSSATINHAGLMAGAYVLKITQGGKYEHSQLVVK